jgi:hypothetical protein
MRGATQRTRDRQARERTIAKAQKAIVDDLARPEVQLESARRDLAMLREEVARLPEYPRSPIYREGELGADIERVEFAGQEVRHLRAERARLRQLLDQAETVLRKHTSPVQAGVAYVRAEIGREMARPAWQPELVGGE